MKQENYRILIVGGTGFIGYHLAKKCIKKNWIVTSLSTKKPNKNRKLDKIKYLYCDISKKKNLKKKLNKNFDYVVNLGGHVEHSLKTKTFLSHYNGAKNLADLFIKTKIKSFIQIGSSAEYGALNSPHKEINITNPKSYYGKAKSMATNYLMKLNKKKKFPLTILRPYQVFGPKQDSNRLIPFVIKNCLDDKTFPCSSGNQFRDFIFIEDIIEVILKCLNNKKSQGEIFNIGSGKPKRVREVISLIRKTIRLGKPKYGTIKLRKEEQLNFFPSISKAKLKIKWKPRHSFIDSLNKTIKSYKK